FDNALPANESTPSLAASATTLSASSTIIRITTGGGVFTDSLGQVWAADAGFNTGNSATATDAIANTVEDALYQSERWDSGSAPEMQYSFTVPNGSYLVRLHFAENFVIGAGKRVFSVDIEGVRRFTGLDVFTEAGGAHIALIKSVTVTVTDGQLNILFLHQTEDPKIDAIEIIGQGVINDTTAPSIPGSLAATALSTTQVALSWSASSDAGTGVAGYRVLRGGVPLTTVTTTSFTDSGLTANTAYTYTVTAFDNALPANESTPSLAASATTLSASSTIIRITTGGGVFTDSLGQVWAADAGFNTGNSATATDAIANTVEDALYQSERWDSGSA
ncbi:MAG: malectin domain-containing carbohydrate-binding protein, partial [Opitutus sp.]